LPSDAEAPLHQWRIDPREYARHEARRGRRFAFVNLVPARTALVVIDMVPFFVSGNPYCRGIVPNIDHIADALRVAGGTVAWVLPAVGERTPVLDEFFGPETAEAYRASGGTGPLPGRLWPELVVRPGDVLVEKSAPSANAARRDQDHNATLHTIYRSFGDVRSTSDLLQMIQDPDAAGTV
jgi:hypothetical protein